MASVQSANGRPNVPLPGAPAERFLGWALPLLSNANSNGEAAEVALLRLHEFLTAGETSGIERYIPSVLRSCQALLEDEGTPLNLLQPLLGILTVLASRFKHIFQPHFVDLVDLLLGWALMPDLSETDRCLITDSFLHFQNFWAGNLPFSSNLLSKFLGDMEVLAHDAIPGTSANQPKRLWALASCFVAVLRATTSGILEFGFAEDSVDCFQMLLPRLLACLGMVRQKFRTFKWLKEATTCLSLFANLFREKFSKFSCLATDFLLKSLEFDHFPEVSQKGNIITSAACSRFPTITSSQVQEILKVNLELFSLQGIMLPPDAVSKLLQTGSSFSRLRLHPSRVVTGVVSETYLLMLRHDAEQVGRVVIDCLIDELIALKSCLCNICKEGVVSSSGGKQESSESWESSLSELEVRELIKYDLLVLTCSVHLMHDQDALEGSRSEERRTLSRANDIRKFLLEQMNPFENPLQYYADVQFALVQSLHRLYCLKCTKISDRLDGMSLQKGVMREDCMCKIVIGDCLSGCDKVIAKALHASASFPVKIEALDWLGSVSSLVLAVHSDSFRPIYIDTSSQDANDNEAVATGNFCLSKDIISALLTAASDREQKVRGKVAIILELLSHAMLITPPYLEDVAEVALEHLGDPDPATQNAFRRVLAVIAPASLWTIGWTANVSSCNRSSLGSTHRQWKQVFALRRFSRHLRPQQVVFILTYIAQQWQVLPSFWLQRLIQNLPKDMHAFVGTDGKGLFSIQESGLAKLSQVNPASISLSVDFELLERACASSNLASAWWAIQEAARHCVTARLRTHLGGPTQTFGMLERMLLDVVQSLQADNSRREAGSAVAMPNIQLLPMRLLLEFVDALKKNIHNASEGSIVLPIPSPTSAHFFRANRKVCEEWFARICEALMNASLALQCHAATYHHAVLRLHDLRSAAVPAVREIQWPQTADSTSNLKLKVRQDVLKTLRLATLALCRACEPSMILGLQTWATSTFGALLSDDTLSLQTGSGAFVSLSWMSGMALQAQGHYERSAAAFSKLLQSDDALGALGADGVQFIIARTIESYVALADWETFEVWLQELQTLRAQHAGKAYAGALTTAGHDMNSIHALACFDAGDVQGAWGHLDLTPQSSGDLTPDPHQALKRSEQMLLQALLRSEGGTHEICVKDTEKAKTMLEEALFVSGFDGLAQAAPLLMHLHCIKAFEVKCNTPGIREKDSLPYLALFNPLEQVDCLSLDAFHQDCLLWLKLLRIYKAVIPRFKVTAQLQWHLVRLARKQHNFKLCHRLLNQLSTSEAFSVQSEADHVLGESFVRLDYERVLLQYAEENSQEAIMGLWHLVQSYIISPKKPSDCKKAMIAKACLKFASWIKQKPTLPAVFFSRMISDIKEDVGLGTSIFVEDGGLQRDASRLPAHSQQEVIGAAIKSAALLCPSMGKAWFAYGTWCFHLAKLSFSGSSALKHPCLFPQTFDSEFAANSSTFSEKEVEGIRAIVLDAVHGVGDAMLTNLPIDAWKSSGIQIRVGSHEAFVQHIVYLMQMAAGAVESDGESPCGVLSLQLKQEMLGLCHGMTTPHAVLSVNKLMEIWWALRKRRVSLYKHALQGFLKYLSFSNWKDHGHGLMGIRMKQHRQDHTLTSSLYVLHILFNHGVELDDTLRKGLSSISPVPWQEVTAQLFARLTNHPEPQVRKQLEDLLMTLAHSSPWAIVYSVLVNLSTSDGEPSAELQRLLGCLLKMHPKLVKDVQLLIAELGGITVLWEEQWLSTLQDLHADVVRRISLLKDEALRFAEDNTLSSTEKLSINASKYSAVMLPTLALLERTMAITSRSPRTVHEAWFQEQYGPQLKAAISALKSPPLNLSSISDVWRPFDATVASLASHVKRSFIPLSDVAPRLAALGSSNVPIPGLEKQVSATHEGPAAESLQVPGIVTVTAFDKQVQVLATKTKPKKLTMMGSDGQAYTYLLKGHEDLRLDARIMQLLRAVNGMLSNYSTTRGRCLAARYYSVTPISGQAGLIQWVDNLVSMYAVFKAWQQRNHSVQFANSSNVNPPVPQVVPRPSDMFYGKMLPALKERGLRKVLSRRDWPQEVKRKVLLELMKETPRQLLYKELWCASDGFTSFNMKLQRFSGSVAVMSMVGHILGLGDRHLDNILMDFSTGNIVHIDYNVCFEKGLRLKIPEIVPFRLTQTIQAALGLTGVEGAFRQSCENVLETLRQNKDVILMLLDVFIWDPLMEWTKGDGGHEVTLIGEEDKKGMEMLVTSSLFGLHAQESCGQLQASEAVMGSQEARSQEDLMTCGLAESSPRRDHVEQLADMGENLGESLDEHILSQAENDCWISPPDTDLASSLDKEVQNPLESFWLQSADSLSGSRIWQSTLTSDLQEQKDSGNAISKLSTLVIQEEKVETSLLQLHSQGGAAFLGGANADIEAAQVSEGATPMHDELQGSLSPGGLPFHSPSGLLMGASSGFMDRSDNDQTSPEIRQSRQSIGSNGDTYASALYSFSRRPSPKRNPYAVSVLEKVEWKLDGLDHESRRHLTVSEQVDYLLRQAMSIDNLCNMYEGWTPWI